MKFKKMAVVAAAFFFLIGTASCTVRKENKSQDIGDNSSGGQEETLTIWAWDEAFNIQAARDAAELYREENKQVEIQVEAMTQDDLVAKLNASLSSQSYEGLPDIVLIEDYRAQGYLNRYPKEFSDLSDIVRQENFAEYKTAVNQVNGIVYGVPFDSGAAVTFYRADLIEAAGYTKEDMKNLTWEKYIEIGKAVREETGAYMLTLDPTDIGQIRMMMQSAGSWYTDEEGQVFLEGNQALKDALAVYKRLVDSGIATQAADWNQFVGNFHKGRVATVPTGCWIAPTIQQAAHQSGKWAVAAFPRMETNPESINASSIGGGGWYVLKNAGHEVLAKDFLEHTFAQSVDLMNQLAEDITLVSTLNAASRAESYSVANEFFGGQEIFADFAQWTSRIPAVNYGKDTYSIENLMTEALQAVLNGREIDGILKDYQKQAEAAVAK